MFKPKKKSTLFRGEQNDRLCLNCGFPNRKSDSNCMYCKSSLLNEDGLVSWIRNTYYVIIWRWQLKQQRDRIVSPSGTYFANFKFLGYFIFGITFSMLGLYLFSEALADSSFSSGLVGILFLCYGILTLKSVFVKK